MSEDKTLVELAHQNDVSSNEIQEECHHLYRDKDALITQLYAKIRQFTDEIDFLSEELDR